MKTIGSNAHYINARAPRRDNPNIEMPPDDSIPLAPDEDPDEDHGPPVETPPPDGPNSERDPAPIREPGPDPDPLLM